MQKREVTPIRGMSCIIVTPMLKPAEGREPTFTSFVCNRNREKMKEGAGCATMVVMVVLVAH